MLSKSDPGNPCIHFAGQTGFEARRVVERRFERSPEAGTNQSLPVRNDLQSPCRTALFEPESARPDVPDFVMVNALEDRRRAPVPGFLEGSDRRGSDVETARLEDHRHDGEPRQHIVGRPSGRFPEAGRAP